MFENKVHFYDENGKVIESVIVKEQVDCNRAILSNTLPEYTPKEGYYGELYVEDKKLVWHFMPVDSNHELTGEELVQIFEEVM